MKITSPQFLRGVSAIFTAAKAQPGSTTSLALKVITTRNSPVVPNARAEVNPLSTQVKSVKRPAPQPTLAMKQSVAVAQNPAAAGENRLGADKSNLSTPPAAPLMPHRAAPAPTLAMQLEAAVKAFEQNPTAARQKIHLQHYGSKVIAAQNDWLAIASGNNGVQK